MRPTLVQRDHSAIWHPFTPSNSEPPLPVISAKGSLLYLEHGRTLIDAISSWWVTCHGHCHPHITQKIEEQLDKLHHVIFSGFTHEPAVTLAERVLNLLPNGNKVFFSDNGSTAVEVALKMAIQYWRNNGEKRKKILALEGAYHGDTFGAMSTGARDLFVAPFKDYLFEVVHIPLDLSTLNERLEKEISTNDVVTFILEPLIQGVNGMNIYSEQILSTIFKITKNYNIPIIADEIFTGFGKTGRYFACDGFSRQPDIVCLSKGLTGGTLPLGLTVCSEEIFNAFKNARFEDTFFHGHSFTGNPIVCAAANASLDLFELDSTWANIERISECHRAFITKLSSHPKIKNARSIGTIIAFDLITKEAPGYSNPARQTIVSRSREKGILLRPLGNVVYCIPPYCITDSELAQVYDAMLYAVEGI